MSPLDVVMVAACPFPCARGTPVRILRLAEALAARGHRVRLVTYSLGDDATHLPFRVHRTPRVPFYRRRAPGPSWPKLLLLDPLLLRELGRVLRAHPSDVIHAHHYEGLAVALRAARGTATPVVYDAHTLLASELPFYPIGLPARLKAALGARLDRALPRRAAHVIAVTQAIRAGLVERFGLAPERVTVVNNGIETGHFPAPEAGGLRVPAAQPTLVFTGNMAPYQGVELMLRVLRLVIERRPGVRLRIVSNASFGPYEALAARLGVRAAVDVVSAEFRDLPRRLEDVAVALNPRTRCDGVPQKLLNYMAAGLPIVSFEGSAEPLEDGATARLVPDDDVRAFATAVLELLADPTQAARLADGARRASRRYTWDRAATETERVYARVLGRAGAPSPEAAPLGARLAGANRAGVRRGAA